MTPYRSAETGLPKSSVVLFYARCGNGPAFRAGFGEIRESRDRRRLVDETLSACGSVVSDRSVSAADCLLKKAAESSP
jgi:hypothetical protein